MKTLNKITVSLMVLLCSLFSSCSVVEGIFKTGMGVGIFISILVVVGIVALIMRSGKK